LYACWAKKGDRRYRYFVSRNLIRGADKTDDRGWRLPAEETEHAVISATRQILSDRGALASSLEGYGLSAAGLRLALNAVDRQVKSFEEIGPIETAGTVIERVELKRDCMQITLNLRALLTTGQFPEGGANLRMTCPVPMQMKRRGVQTRPVIPGEPVARSRTDPALLRASARGYRWFAELASGRAASTRQIAAREGLSHSYVRHTAPLGLLAPKVVEAICAGQQAVTLSAERLKDLALLPIEWDAQQRFLSDSAASRFIQHLPHFRTGPESYRRREN